jgi:hypothetical protein
LPKLLVRSGSEVSAPSPLPQRSNAEGDPLSGFGSPTEFHQCATAFDPIPRLSPQTRIVRPFQGFVPFSVFTAARSHIAPVSFHFTGYVASLGFRNLSTPCSSRNLPGLFHPGPTLGVSLRGFSPPKVPYALSNAITLMQLGVPRTSHRRSRALLTLGIPYSRPGV